jgi:hypothetical protein
MDSGDAREQILESLRDSGPSDACAEHVSGCDACRSFLESQVGA